MERWSVLLCLLVAFGTCMTQVQFVVGNDEDEVDPEHAHPDKLRTKPPSWLPPISDRLLQLLDIREENGSYVLPKLRYDYDALEPYMSERTVRIHHTGHHASYTSRMNSILEHMTTDDVVRNPVEHLMHLDDLIEDFRGLYCNQAGGYVNHAFTFFVMGKLDQNKEEEEQGPKGKILEMIETTYGTADILIDRFSSIATQVFGSGYVWLCLDNKGRTRLQLIHTTNQNTPLADGYRPVLAIDLWEHAYYLQYQNKRTDYITTWWQLVDWDRVNELLVVWLETSSVTDGDTDGEAVPEKEEL